ncbi:hypothetical protein HYT92_02055 [Candidatus Pacearchaeota archaeon]|nr:hypothetical protein [Candidatus Pacearchaeota archaeon]
MKGRKEKRKWGLIIFIVFIMIGTTFSFVFFGFQPQSDVVKHNGMKFVRYADRWEAEINGKRAAFSFLPAEITDLNASDDFSKMLQNKIEIDVTYDSNDTYKESIALAQHQMGLVLSQYGVFMRKGFINNNTFNVPVITCNDSSANVPVVYFKTANSTNIRVENNCVIAEASSEVNFLKIKDRLLYGILGVMS